MVGRLLNNVALLSLFSMALLLAGNAHAAKPIENVEGSSIPAGLSDEQIAKTIQRGGAARGWVIKKVAAGHLEATIFVRSHMAKVDINYSNDSYSIRYNDSENLGYKNGKIHRNYNKWVKTLNMDIQREFAML